MPCLRCDVITHTRLKLNLWNNSLKLQFISAKNSFHNDLCSTSANLLRPQLVKQAIDDLTNQECGMDVCRGIASNCSDDVEIFWWLQKLFNCFTNMWNLTVPDNVARLYHVKRMPIWLGSDHSLWGTALLFFRYSILVSVVSSINSHLH